MKKIELRGDRGRGNFVLVDDEDYGKLNKFKWCYGLNGYATRSTYNLKTKKRGHEMMHRVISGQKYIDHIDGNKLNNQKSNLRPASFSENNFNLPKRKGTSSKYKGVYWYKAYKMWSVMLQKHRKRYFVGYFRDEDEAGKAYNEKAKELFGEFARLNNI